MHRRIAPVIFAFAVLGTANACVPYERVKVVEGQQIEALPRQHSDFRNLLKGRTVVFEDKSHGTQVEYFASNYQAYLWYPGNIRAVNSKWKVQPAPKLICFKYPETSRNPISGSQGGDWGCYDPEQFRRKISAVFEGDPFGLETGKVPQKLNRNTSVSDLLRMSPTGQEPTIVFRK